MKGKIKQNLNCFQIMNASCTFTLLAIKKMLFALNLLSYAPKIFTSNGTYIPDSLTLKIQDPQMEKVCIVNKTDYPSPGRKNYYMASSKDSMYFFGWSFL